MPFSSTIDFIIFLHHGLLLCFITILFYFQIEKMSSLDLLNNLQILDLSFNSIRSLIPLQCCPLLEELYVAQNKLRMIEGLDGLIHLRVLDLGANRIRSMNGLESLTSLQSLWLGKNKIEYISGGIKNMHKLRQLDIQNNRLTSLGDELSNHMNMEELYLAWNNITSLEGLPVTPLLLPVTPITLDIPSTEENTLSILPDIPSTNELSTLPPNTPIITTTSTSSLSATYSKLSTLDLSNNPISNLDGIENQMNLSELWLTKTEFTNFEALGRLARLPVLSCVYLEHSPVAKLPNYKENMVSLLPHLEQLDALML